MDGRIRRLRFLGSKGEAVGEQVWATYSGEEKYQLRAAKPSMRILLRAGSVGFLVDLFLT